MAEKLGMKSMDNVAENIRKIAELFPNVIKECKNSGGGYQI